jgi:hypothetical protein
MNSEAKSWNRPPRNLDEVLKTLIPMAKKVGSIYGVFLSVGLRGDCLFFVDEGGHDIIDPGGVGNPASSVLCATASEIDSGDFLKLFSGRVLYASLVIRFTQAEMADAGSL